MKFKLSLLLLLLMPIFLIGQTKKGFKHFKKKRYEKAEKAFEKDKNHPSYAAAALYGLAKLKARTRRNYQQLIEANELSKLAKTQFNPVDKKSKSKYKKWKIYARSFDRQERTIQKKALDIVASGSSLTAFDDFLKDFDPVQESIQEKAAELRIEVEQKIQEKALKKVEAQGSIIAYDDFITAYSPLQESVQKKAEELRKQLITNSLDRVQSLTYNELTSLVNNHEDILLRNSFKFKNVVMERLWEAFIKEYGYENLDQFVVDHPRHWVAAECRIDEFVAAAKAPTKKVLINFVQQYPFSLLESHAVGLIIGGKKEMGILNEEEQTMLNFLKLGIQLDQNLRNKDNLTSQPFYEELVAYIEEAAPAVRAYRFTKKAIQAYLKAKNWELVLALTKATQPFFLDEQPADCDANFMVYHTKQDWFETAINIFSQETDNIELLPIEELNTPRKDEASPVIMANGQELYFAANGYKKNLGNNDIYYATYNGKKWTSPQLVKELSTKQDEAPLSITSDGKNLLLFRAGKLYLSHITPKGWSPPQPLSKKVNAFEWIGRAVLSPDGKVLIFAASNWTKESYYLPMINIYVSKRQPDGSFGNPFSIGRDINTFGEERSPYLHIDGKTLYFSSDGHGGLGGIDVLMSTRLDSTWTNWSTPVNLGKEINTLENDWGYNLNVSPSANKAYLSSDALHWSYQSDLFTATVPRLARAIPKKVITAKLKRNSDKPIGNSATIIIRDARTGEEITRVTPRPDGTFIFPMDINRNQISYEVRDTNALPVSGILDTREKENLFFLDQPIAYITKEDLADGTARLENVHFETRESILLPKSYKIIEGLYSLIKHEKKAILHIAGHTDNQGNDDFNKELSLLRADAVKAYLVQLGLDKSQVITIGYGHKQPIADNSTEEGQALNRRVEVQLKFIK